MFETWKHGSLVECSGRFTFRTSSMERQSTDAAGDLWVAAAAIDR